jgi:hypothetical protein
MRSDRYTRSAVLISLLFAVGCDSDTQSKLSKAKDELETARAEAERARAGASAAEAELATLRNEVEIFRRRKIVPYVTTEGSFSSVPGETGFQAFGEKYTGPPRVTWNQSVSSPDRREVEKLTIIVDITGEGFRWKNVGNKEAKAGTFHWRASGTAER